MIDASTQQIASDIVAKGAILRVRIGYPRVFHVNLLVGYFEWLDDHRAFYFEAGGQNEFAGHILTFETAQAAHSLGVAFRNGCEIVAYLCPISEASVEDQANFVVTWRAWQTALSQRGESVTEFIRETRDQIAT